MKSAEDLIKKIEECKQRVIDLSLDEDLTVALMNLISLEEHLFFSGAKTGKSCYYDLLDQIRVIRKELLARIVKDPEGEVWCISKHLLATTMRLVEVGTKYLSQNKKEDAQKLFEQAYTMYSIFWALNLNLIGTSSAQTLSHDTAKQQEKSTPVQTKEKTMLQKLGDKVTELINCCIE